MEKKKHYLTSKTIKKFRFLVYICIALSLLLVVIEFSGDPRFSKQKDEVQKTSSEKTLTTLKTGKQPAFFPAI